MAENFLTVLALVASTAAIVLGVTAAASKEWVGHDGSTNDFHCGLAQCCSRTSCMGAVDFVAENLDSFDTKPADVTVTIIFMIMGILTGAIAWAYALRKVFSDAGDAAIMTCGKLGLINAVMYAVALAVYGASGIEEDVGAWARTNLDSAIEDEFGWGFYALVGALATQAFAVILFFLSPVIKPSEADKPKSQFTGAGPQGV